jgi:hypothetical protein
MTAYFPLGALVMTSHAAEVLDQADIGPALARHSRGDWGDVSSEDWLANEAALAEGTRLLSAYVAGDGTRFWIITEADRSATTVLLPEDY